MSGSATVKERQTRRQTSTGEEGNTFRLIRVFGRTCRAVNGEVNLSQDTS